MTIKKETLLGLNGLLKLKYKGLEQDWEIEFADPNRVEEFIGIANRGQLSTMERYAVVCLIISSLDDRLNLDHTKNNDRLWEDIVALLDHEPSLYLDLLHR
jgi:hypothetical protein